MIGLNTNAPQVLFNGAPVPGIVAIKADWEADDRRVRIHVNGNDDALYQLMSLAGVSIKKVPK